MRYSKIVLHVILVICVGLTTVIAIQANTRKVQQEETVVTSQGIAVDEALQPVPQVPLEEASPEIVEIFNTYYTAIVEGDTETMAQMVYYKDSMEILRASETSKYIESYPLQEIYTKAGPKDVKAVDQAAARGLIHRNNAARKKSGLTLRLNKLEG